MDSICIIHDCLKQFLVFSKMLRVCFFCLTKHLPEDRFHEWPWKTRFRLKQSDQQRATHTITPSLRYKCPSVKPRNQMWVRLP